MALIFESRRRKKLVPRSLISPGKVGSLILIKCDAGAPQEGRRSRSGNSSSAGNGRFLRFHRGDISQVELYERATTTAAVSAQPLLLLNGRSTRDKERLWNNDRASFGGITLTRKVLIIRADGGVSRGGVSASRYRAVARATSLTKFHACASLRVSSSEQIQYRRVSG